MPGSKSYTHRAYLISALLAGGRVKHPLCSEDTNATRELLKGFNCNVKEIESGYRIEKKEGLQISGEFFQVGESGTLLRFLIPICTVCEGSGELRIEGSGSLKERSNKIIIDSLQKNDFKIEATGPEKTVPLICYPGQSLPEKPISVAAHTTSQFLSGWLLALAAVGGGEIELSTPLVSAPYVDMTCRVLAEAGAQVNQSSPGRYSVDASGSRELNYLIPADYSSAAFFVVGASLTNSSVVLQGLDPDDVQGDRRIVDIISDLGGNVKWTADGLAISGPFKPAGFEVDAADCPDLVPVLAVLASRASGPVKLFNIEHLANKESDRINMTCRELKKIGLDIRPGSDCIEINPQNSKFHSGEVILKAHNDHRLAMAFSILGLCRGNITVQGAQCVAKSYPEFYEDLLGFGATFEKVN